MDTLNDYYAVLGVDQQANASAIKTAFKRLALQYHPDLYKGADAQERMRELLQAYQVLNDPVARKEYDSRRRGEQKHGAEKGEGRVRQEKQARYAFPDLSQTPTSVLVFSLEEITYRLSSAQAESLKWDGLFRGKEPGPGESSARMACICHRCHHRWEAQGKSLFTCPACHAGDWAEYLLLRCTHCQAIFESKEIRDPLRGNSLYHPYELFPLCPHCRRSQWCPAEDRRINALRAAAARSTALFWIGAFGVCIVLLAFLALVILR